MNTKQAERVFVQILSHVDKAYEEQCNMIMDAFIEDEFTMGELKRLVIYVLDYVLEDKREQVTLQVERIIGSLSDQ